LECDQDELERLVMNSMSFEKGSKFSFSAWEEDKQYYQFPGYRIRELRNNGEAIWEREKE